MRRGVTRASFHLVGKQPLIIDKLINLVNGCTKTGETSFKTLTLISSAPVTFDDDKISINLSEVVKKTYSKNTKAREENEAAGLD